MAMKNWLDGTADWYTPADWNGGTLPGPTDDIVINTGAPFLQSGDGAVTVNSIMVGASATFQLAGNSALTITGDFANSGALDVDINGFDGGASLTIGGTLTNTKTVQIGPNNATLGADIVVTAAKLVNPGTISLFGCAAHVAKLTVNGTATSLGAVNIGAFANFTVSRAGVSQIATITNAGTLEAAGGAWIDVTGPVAGGGQLKIDAGSEIELGAPTREAATFSAATGKLRLDMPKS
jgi:hypothetical protein